MAIFLDTNALSRGRRPLTVTHAALRRLADHIGVTVIIPDLVVDESVSARTRILAEALSSVSSAVKKAAKTIDLDAFYLPDAEELASEWRRDLIESFEILEVSGDDAREALSREALRRKPAKQGGTGARDCAIWLTVKRYHEAHGGPTYFVSDNVDDFASPDKSRLHQDLIAEVEVDFNSLRLVRNVSALLEMLAEKVTLEITPDQVSGLILDSLGEQLALVVADDAEVFTADVLLEATPIVESSRVIVAYAVHGTGLGLVDLVVRAQLIAPVPIGEGQRAHAVRFSVRAWIEVDLASRAPTAISVEFATLQGAEVNSAA